MSAGKRLMQCIVWLPPSTGQGVLPGVAAHDLRGEEASFACCWWEQPDGLPEAQEACPCSTVAHRVHSAIAYEPCCQHVLMWVLRCG